MKPHTRHRIHLLWQLPAVALACLFGIPDRTALASPAVEQNPLVSRLHEVMRAQVADGFSGVVYVSRGGDVLLHEGYGYADRKTRRSFTTNTVVDSGSFAKQITATAAVRLSLEDRLSLETTLSDYFPDVPEDKADLTVEQLLSHSSGLAGWVFPHDFTPIETSDWLQLVFETPLEHPPGTRYLYSNDGVTLVSLIVEKITGKPHQEHLRETMFKPLEMTHTGWYDTPVFDDPNLLVATGYLNGKDEGAPNEWSGPYRALLGNGGIIWTVTDMLKWHDAVHKTWLPDVARELLFAPVIPDPESFLYPNETAPMHYALGWRVGTSACGDERRSHTGTGISHNIDYRYYVDRDLLIYVASNKIDSDYLGNETIYARTAAQALTQALMDGCP